VSPPLWTRSEVPAEAFVGIDVGTTHTKGALIGAGGVIYHEAKRASDLQSPHATWAEMDPAQWWANTCSLGKELAAVARERKLSIAGIGVSGMVPALVLLDAAGTPVRPSIQQNDARTTVEIAELKDGADETRFFQLTGGSINQQVMAPKLRWLARHEPEIMRDARILMGSYDYIALKLTGTVGVEHNWALESGLSDVRSTRWVPELIELAGIDASLLPAVRSSHEIVGWVTDEAAVASGLPAGVPVVAGVADHVASAFAAGVADDGDLLIKFGGAGDVLYATEELVTDPRLFIDYHVIPGRYLLNGCMATSGSMLKWLLRELLRFDATESEDAGLDPFETLDAIANLRPPGSHGIIVLPYFLGEKTPLHDPNARGTIVGLGLHHDRFDVYRAFLEAVVYGFRHHVDVLGERNLDVHRVLASDGGARSDVWLQIASDVLGMPVHRVSRHPGSSLGAAFVAAKAVGAVTDWDDIAAYVDVLPPFEPRPEAVRVYDTAYGVYRESYERLKTLYPDLGRFAQGPSGGEL
jgi:xylulokinase